MPAIRLNREAGISFIIRCRNEQDYLEGCISSLKNLNIPHQIVVVLHCCTDNSRVIAEKLKLAGQPIEIYEHDHPVSRAGYETLVTPVYHPSSFARYSTYCFSKANYNWIMKWDADFIATPALIDFLNRLDIANREPRSVRIGCRLGEETVNAELYLTNALIGFGKYVFWEVPIHQIGHSEVSAGDAEIQSISNTILKEYWREQPWFLAKDGDEQLASDYDFLASHYGSEPAGLARASHPACDDIFRRVLVDQALLASRGINFQ